MAYSTSPDECCYDFSTSWPNRWVTKNWTKNQVVCFFSRMFFQMFCKISFQENSLYKQEVFLLVTFLFSPPSSSFGISPESVWIGYPLWTTIVARCNLDLDSSSCRLPEANIEFEKYLLWINSSHLKHWGWKDEKFPFGARPPGRCYVSFGKWSCWKITFLLGWPLFRGELLGGYPFVNRKYLGGDLQYLESVLIVISVHLLTGVYIQEFW